MIATLVISVVNFLRTGQFKADLGTNLHPSVKRIDERLDRIEEFLTHYGFTPLDGKGDSGNGNDTN